MVIQYNFAYFVVAVGIVLVPVLPQMQKNASLKMNLSIKPLWTKVPGGLPHAPGDNGSPQQAIHHHKSITEDQRLRLEHLKQECDNLKHEKRGRAQLSGYLPCLSREAISAGCLYLLVRRTEAYMRLYPHVRACVHACMCENECMCAYVYSCELVGK